MKREELVRLAQVAIREEIVRHHRRDERTKCAAGSAFYEEEVAPYQIAQAALTAILEGLRDMDNTAIARAEAYSDFVLPEGFDNTAQGRRRELRNAFLALLSTLDDRSTGGEK